MKRNDKNSKKIAFMRQTTSVCVQTLKLPPISPQFKQESPPVGGAVWNMTPLIDDIGPKFDNFFEVNEQKNA